MEDRVALYTAIEKYRKRPLIIYATSTRPNVPAMMAADAVREFIDQIDAIKNGKSVDVLVHSSGGDGLTAWKLMSVLRERFDNVAVLVPFMAFSAATLFALGADEIIMHPHASLGPIDPQITMPQPDGKLRTFAYEDVGAFLRFLGSDVRVTEQAHITAIIERLFAVVDPVNIGAAKRASELSSAVGERLLSIHMSSSEDKPRAKQIAENLNKSFFAHGDAVSRSRAKELQLKIADSDLELERLIWGAYLGLEDYMELRRQFVPLQHFLANPAAAEAVKLSRPASVPPNIPPVLAQQMLQQGMPAVASVPEVEYGLINAVIESARIASEFRTEGIIQGFRAPNGQIQLVVTDTSSGWKRTFPLKEN